MSSQTIRHFIQEFQVQFEIPNHSHLKQKKTSIQTIIESI